uniref:Serpin domain-containing protein n=1 Tax=Denticeps clupeoides TaxID=299321 RepID=A0AAY4EAB3_9TELE
LGLYFLLVHVSGVFMSPTYGERGSDLGLQVFKHVVQERPGDNVLLSPHGVASILGMLLPGAHGTTRKQLLSGLRYKKNGPYKMLQKLHKSLTGRSNADVVIIANGLFPQEGFSLKPNFLSTNRENFLSESHTLNYSQPEQAAAVINDWVRTQSKGHIPSLVQAEMLDPAMTRLVVVNSIYFKGRWKSRFQPESTKMKRFNKADGSSYLVRMMSQVSVFNIGIVKTPDGLMYKVIELPYHGDSLSMFIALPSEEETPLSSILPHISTATVKSWSSQLTQWKIGLLLPKFKIEGEVDLQTPLSAMGIKDLFSQSKADFSQLSSEHIYVSRALQKAVIEVSEDGTKAAASTTAVVSARSSPQWISIDRPFLFLIRHNPSGTILFVGQINQP